MTESLDLPGLLPASDPEDAALRDAPRVRGSLVYENEIPLLEEVYERGGRPGEVYAFVSLDHVFVCQERGFRQVEGSPTFRVIGPRGEVDCLWLAHRDYAPIPGMRPESGRRLAYVDDTILARTGVGLEPRPTEGQPKTPEKKEKARSEAGQDRMEGLLPNE